MALPTSALEVFLCVGVQRQARNGTGYCSLSRRRPGGPTNNFNFLSIVFSWYNITVNIERRIYYCDRVITFY